jgi:16S rRNA (uracil1498-N3)-methyltransferase
VITLLIDPRRLAAGDGEEGGDTALCIEGEAYRHLFRARRLAPGERLRLVDGEGRARWGEVLGVDRAVAKVSLGAPADPNEPALHLELLAPTLRPERASWLVEKATELGAAAVTFHNSERAPRTFGGGTLARLRRVAAAAVEQSHRSLCPEIAGPLPLGDLLRPAAGAPARAGAARLWLLEPEAAVAGFPPDPGGIAAGNTAGARILVGPEGGWTPAELAAIRAAGWQGVSLGPRILRIETAALAAAALLLVSAQ